MQISKGENGGKCEQIDMRGLVEKKTVFTGCLNMLLKLCDLLRHAKNDLPLHKQQCGIVDVDDVRKKQIKIMGER